MSVEGRAPSQIEQLRGLLHKDVEGTVSDMGGNAGGKDRVGNIDGLNHLSDIAGRLGGRTGQFSGVQSQETEPLVEPHQSLQLGAPSQPDLPPPNLHVDSQGHGLHIPSLSLQPGSNPADYFAQYSPEMQQLMMQQNAISVQHFIEQTMSQGGLLPEELAPPGKRSNKKVTRRGPMDEMRQLIRILVKLFPQSIGFIGTAEEAGGGNRISEDQIKTYLKATLGDAPKPIWGVPEGWGQYLADLFIWGTGKHITAEQAMRCAKREPGRSWEAVETELRSLGLHPHCWPLPLSKHTIMESQQNPIPQPIPKVSGGKRSAPENAVNGYTKRQRAVDRDLKKMSELELWEHIIDACNVLVCKAGTYEDQPAVVATRDSARARLGALLDSEGGPLGMSQFAQFPYITDPGMLQMLQGIAAGNMTAPGHQVEVAAPASGPGKPGSTAQEEEAAAAAARGGKSSEARGALFGALSSAGDPSNALSQQYLYSLMPHMMVSPQTYIQHMQSGESEPQE